MMPYYPNKTAGNLNKKQFLTMCTPDDSHTLLSRKKSCSSVFSIPYLPTKLTPIPKSSSTMETREEAYV
jgi:hypothetical protein